MRWRAGSIADVECVKEDEVKIPANTFILVADGRKALLLSNHGDAVHPDLRLDVSVENAPNPLSHEQGRDRPGRAFQSVGHRRSAVETMDIHQESETAFAAKAAEITLRAVEKRPSAKIVVVAPPVILAELRSRFSTLGAQVIAEIAKDLTKHPISEIAAILAAR
jgi:protein required for attachment to host cells